jgi:hypothetical protein
MPTDTYERLRSLYLRKDTSLDAFSIGAEIEIVVAGLFKEIAFPLLVESQPRLVDYAFDLRLELGRSEFSFVETLGRNLSIVKLNRLYETGKQLTTSFPTASFHLVAVAKGLEDQDRSFLNRMRSNLSESRTTFTYIHYEILIALHKFLSESLKARDVESRSFKRMFLGNLFQNTELKESDFFPALEKSSISRGYAVHSKRSEERGLEMRQQEELSRIRQQLKSIEEQLNTLIAQMKRLQEQKKAE